jgi:NAD(P)-dependent dehydrogenase (short-subunit alcohol dehydrogenase family)
MLLEGKRIIATGAVGGIGLDSIAAFVQHGARVAASDLAVPNACGVAELLGRTNADRPDAVSYHQVDVTNAHSVTTAFTAAAEELGGVDAVFNLAGVEQPPTSAESISEAEMRRQLDVHMMGTFFTNQAAFDLLKLAGGSIVNYSSIVGVEGFAMNAAYGAAKGAVAAWTRNVARDWGKYNIRVNTVCPGALTRMVEEAIASYPADQQQAQYEALDAQVLLGNKLLKADKVAGINVFLASDLSNWVHGQTIAADGGMFMVR